MHTESRFAGLGLAQPLLRAIAETGYETPTPIQAQAIPVVLSGADLLAAAQTGTGKTAAFVLPILHHLVTRPAPTRGVGRPRCLILTPTRELAAQVEESVRTYGNGLPVRSMVMFGGVGIQPQVAQLRKGVDLLVATPGRLLDHAGQKTLDLSAVEILVLDEGDRMLDMGFIPAIRRVIALLPKKRQSMLFSATFSDEVRALAATLLDRPASIDVAPRNAPSALVQHGVHLVPQDRKRDLLAHLIRSNGWEQVLVFTRTKHGANRLAEKLVRDGIPAVAIHGNKSQSARTRALGDFKSGAVPVLVATDLAARGLDIEELPHVVNFELPHVPEDYVHRIGRTGRAGLSGAAVSLVSPDEIPLLRGIERLLRQPIERMAPQTFAAGIELESAPASTGSAGSHTREPREPRERHGHRQDERGRRHTDERGARPAPRGLRQPDALARGGDARSPSKPRQAESAAGGRMSEAARHQALPQPALFRPAAVSRRRG
jgi:ATP-dependent RNA helicase RhlE